LLAAEFYSKKTKQAYKLTSPLSGKYQLKNLAAVICTLENLQEIGLKIQKKHITSGIRKVVTNTGLMGRWQTISQNPLTIADIGHNPDGIREVLEQIALTPHEKLHFVMGVVNDKDVKTMLSKLPKDASYYFCKADIPRGLDAEKLTLLANEFSLKGKAFGSVKEALKTARLAAAPYDLVLVGGSAFVVAEVV
jgi:dihydrofolate synthase/folylpolyglutamate synthase